MDHGVDEIAKKLKQDSDRHAQLCTRLAAAEQRAEKAEAELRNACEMITTKYTRVRSGPIVGDGYACIRCGGEWSQMADNHKGGNARSALCSTLGAGHSRKGEVMTEIDYTDIRDDEVRTKVRDLMSAMLDNPDEYGIYPTSEFMWKMETYILEYKIQLSTEKARADKTEVRIKELEAELVRLKCCGNCKHGPAYNVYRLPCCECIRMEVFRNSPNVDLDGGAHDHWKGWYK